MRFLAKIVLISSIASLLVGQDLYHSLDEIKDEWKDYTHFQRGELLNFCNFLYDSGFYNRAVVSLYQFLYRFPGDRMENVIYYKLGRSLEETGKWVEARQYYRDLESTLDTKTVEYKAAQYHDFYLQYRLADYQNLISRLDSTRDPYHLLIRGYSELATGDYQNARITFLTAEETLNETYYIDKIQPIVHLIDSVQVVPQKKRLISFFSSLIPGGGKGYIGDWQSAAGILLTTGIALWISPNTISGQHSMKVVYPVQDILPKAAKINSGKGSTFHYPQDIASRNNNQRYMIGPVSVMTTLYIVSIWHSVSEVGQVNQKAVDDYVKDWIVSYPLKQFMDFPEPELDKNK